MMQIFRLGTFTAVLLLTLSGGGCNKDKDSDTAGPDGQECQGPNVSNGKFICPTGYYCKYENENDMLHENKLGQCKAMDQYKPCQNMTLCGSSDYSPKCETINETAYCDWLQPSLRCKCEGPGPFVEGEVGGEVKSPTTTTPTTTK